jgi:saposin
MHHMEYKFRQTSRDNVLEQFLYMCGEFSSFSDACSSIILTHFETIYSHLQNNFNGKNICHLSGQCSDKFHVHEDDINKVNTFAQLSFNNTKLIKINKKY